VAELLGNSPVAGERQPIGELSAELSESGTGAKALKLKATITKPTGLKASGNVHLIIDKEIIEATMTTSNVTEYTIVARGVEETTAVAHAIGAKVYCEPTRAALIAWLQVQTKIKEIVGEKAELSKVEKLKGEGEGIAGSSITAFKLLEVAEVIGKRVSLGAAEEVQEPTEPEYAVWTPTAVGSIFSFKTTIPSVKLKGWAQASHAGTLLMIVNQNEQGSGKNIVLEYGEAGPETFFVFGKPITLAPSNSAIFEWSAAVGWQLVAKITDEVHGKTLLIAEGSVLEGLVTASNGLTVSAGAVTVPNEAIKQAAQQQATTELHTPTRRLAQLY
jgi:hypothetical protein